MSRSAMFVRWVLGVAAVSFFALGALCYFSPGTVLRSLDIQAAPGKALADIRAVYGGLDVAVGILLGFCFFRKEWANGLAIGALVLACAFAGRLIGIIADPAQDLLTFSLFAVEVVGAVLCAVGWFLSRKEPEVAIGAAPTQTAGVSQP